MGIHSLLYTESNLILDHVEKPIGLGIRERDVVVLRCRIDYKPTRLGRMLFKSAYCVVDIYLGKMGGPWFDISEGMRVPKYYVAQIEGTYVADRFEDNKLGEISFGDTFIGQ